MAAMRWQDDRGEGQLEDALKRFLQDIADHCGEFPETVTVQTTMALPSPAVSVQELGDTYLLLAELPGVEAANLRVTATGRTVTLEGVWRGETPGPRPLWHMNETRQGTFSRVVALPGPVRGESARAVLANGMLQVEVAKATSPNEDSYDVTIPSK